MPLSSSNMPISSIKAQLNSIQEKRSEDGGSNVYNTPDAVYKKGGNKK